MMSLSKFNAVIAEKPAPPYPSGGSWMKPLLPMPASRESEWGSDMPRQAFTTIDDCIELAQELASRLHELSTLEHPLDVRKGVKAMIDPNNAKMVKATTRTYFF